MCWLKTPACLPLCFISSWIAMINVCFFYTLETDHLSLFFGTNISLSHKKLRQLNRTYRLPQRFLANLSLETVLWLIRNRARAVFFSAEEKTVTVLAHYEIAMSDSTFVACHRAFGISAKEVKLCFWQNYLSRYQAC